MNINNTHESKVSREWELEPAYPLPGSHLIIVRHFISTNLGTRMRGLTQNPHRKFVK